MLKNGKMHASLSMHSLGVFAAKKINLSFRVYLT